MDDILKLQGYISLKHDYTFDNMCNDLKYYIDNQIEYALVSPTSHKKIYTILVKDTDDIILKLLEHYKSVSINEKIEYFYDRLKDKNKLSDEIILQSIERFKDNDEKYLAYCQLGEQRGLSIAVYNLGLYFEKKGDYVKMLFYFNQSIEKGNYKAAYYLGNSYKKNKDTENMLKYYLLASEKNIKEVKIELARYYQENNDSDNQLKYLLESKIEDLTLDELLLVAKSFAETNNKQYEYYEHAANKNHLESAYLMANYYKSKGNKIATEKMYIIAIDQCNDTKSLHELIDFRIEENDPYKIKTNTKSGIYNFYKAYKVGKLNIFDPINIKAANSGYEPALFEIACTIYNNKNLKDYLDIMEKYFLKLIEKGNDNAMTYLSNYYLQNMNYNGYFGICLICPDKIDKCQFMKTLESFMNDKKIEEIPESCIDILYKINLSDIDNVPVCIRLLKKLITDQLSLMEMHFKYTVNGKGYYEAKSDFMEKLNNH